jgi:PAS domain S-box-containing protein
MEESEFIIRQLTQENKQLKEKVKDLEAKIAKIMDETHRFQMGKKEEMSRVIKLLEHKDRTREQFIIELEEKNIKLEQTVKEMEEKNKQMQFMLASLRLYQEILEYEPALILAVSSDGKLILFNKAAASTLGESLTKNINRSIYEVDFSPVDPKIPEFIKEVFKNQKSMRRTVLRDKREIVSSGYLVKIANEVRGMVLRITIGQAS